MLKRCFFRRRDFQGVLEGRAFPLISGHTLLESALNAGVQLPYHCQVGTCKSCLCRVVSGKTRSLVELGHLLSQEEIATGHVLACQCLPQSDLTLATASTACTSARVTQVEPLSSTVWRVTLLTARALSFQPGQSVQIGLEKERDIRHFSVSWPSQGREMVVDITRREQGGLSPVLCDARNIGRTVWISDCQGQFGQKDDGKGPLLAIASGSGLGTTLGLVRAALARNPRREVMFIHAVRQRQDKFDLHELQRLRQHYPGFHFLHALSQESAAQEHELAGGVTRWLEDWRALYPAPTQAADWRVMICGNPELAQACQQRLLAGGVKSHLLEMDCFSPPVGAKSNDKNKEPVC